ncbi:MAG: RadC family protein [Gammaproteobacteria bacterium]
MKSNPNPAETFIRDAEGNYRMQHPASADEIVSLAETILRTRVERGAPLTDPLTTKRWLVTRLSGRPYEVFCVLFLDNRHRVIAFEELFRGTIDGASVHPREVAKQALHHNAAAVIFVHNHPSGVAEPSDADRRLTNRLKDALSLLDIRTLDHFVIGGVEAVSFAERGLL